MDASEPTQLLHVFAAMGLVLGLMGLLYIILKKLGFSGAEPLNTKKKRLRLVEVLPLDTRRRLVLIQRDDKQHLVILGSNSETVVETNIESPKDTSSDNET